MYVNLSHAWFEMAVPRQHSERTVRLRPALDPLSPHITLPEALPADCMDLRVRVPIVRALMITISPNHA